MLETIVTVGPGGPLVTLSGEADVTDVAQLGEMIHAQLSGGTNKLTIDLSGLRFADAAAIGLMASAAKTMNQRGGNVILLNPRQAVARILELLQADQIFIIQWPACGPAE
jgi:anti-sigma B factor antagonist